ncbi:MULTISPECIES: anti-sigma-I factor RsgI family protein [Gordonibacter]|uniref:Anti-sigma factor RsgI-like middle domain-containing protein n=1 Tax=Gordonibacter faecis TaxID=3047475 RepID=A0ABT7DJ71_9ACTN|nr:hypothetical protein [Gordonibacter sp. KGMB12511]MDJ1649569.1 hypothetical protein [Gordonibacter sp. KGMB12511]HIW76236.1 hypothetical protein [Candidatus Gordonibacter avicola]
MSDLERRVRDAFNAIELPDEVTARTLAAIDELSASASAPSTEDITSRQPAVDPSNAASQTNTSGAATPTPRRPRVVRWRRAAVALAACLAVAAVGFFGSRLYFEEVAHVGIDVNPSLELGMNRFDIVVSAHALNKDGEALLAAAPVVGKRYPDAMDALTSSEAFAPYLNNTTYIEISVTSDDESRAAQLQTQSDVCLRSLPCESSCHTLDEQTRHEAHAAGMGGGRYKAALRLMELDSTVTLEDCAALSMHELRVRIAALDPEAAADNSTCAGSGAEMGTGSGVGEGHHAGKGHGQGRGAQDGRGRGQGASAEPTN